MAKGIIRLLDIARKNVDKSISDLRGDDMFSRGMASEGYAGGYRDALNDVVLALNGVTPSRNYWWYDERRLSKTRSSK